MKKSKITEDCCAAGQKGLSLCFLQFLMTPRTYKYSTYTYHEEHLKPKQQNPHEKQQNPRESQLRTPKKANLEPPRKPTDLPQKRTSKTKRTSQFMSTSRAFEETSVHRSPLKVPANKSRLPRLDEAQRAESLVLRRQLCFSFVVLGSFVVFLKVKHT